MSLLFGSRMMNDRKRVLDKKELLDIYDMFNNKTLDQVQIELACIATAYNRDILLNDCHVNFSVDYYGYDGGIELYLNTWRWENDEEYNKRKEKEEKAREKSRKIREAKKEKARNELFKKEEDERNEYERLKAKYG